MTPGLAALPGCDELAYSTPEVVGANEIGARRRQRFGEIAIVHGSSSGRLTHALIQHGSDAVLAVG